MRKSGEPYITHPLAVTHDPRRARHRRRRRSRRRCCTTPSRTPTTASTSCARDFGDEIAMLVDGVTKLDKVKYGEAAQAETVRKMIVAMARDIRVLVIKLADRLHNARTWGFVSAESAKRKANETLEIYAPLAHRLGIQTIKWELEDLSFAMLYPKLYDEIESLVAERAPEREEYLAGVIDAGQRRPHGRQDQGRRDGPAQALLLGLPEDDRARPRVRRDLRPRRHPGPRRHGARLLRGARRDPRAVDPGPGPVQGLHRDAEVQPVPVAAHDGDRPAGQPVEIQIRTHEMHRRAEFGVAAHWKYKEQSNGGGPARPGETRRRTTWPGCASCSTGRARPRTRGSSSTRCASRSARNEVYVFTPKGSVVGLPVGRHARRLRLCRAHRGRPPHHGCAGQRPPRPAGVDARERRRRRGVHLARPTAPGPSRDWLQFVKSPRARNKIRQWFTKERRDEAIEQARTRSPRRCASRTCRCSG